MSRESKSRRVGFGELAIAIVSLIITLVACEFVVRNSPLGDKMGWTMVPPVEDRVRAAENEQRRPRVLIVGDSQTEWRDTTGESYVRVAERQFATKDRRAHFINLAQAGTDVDQYFVNLIRHADRLKPDLVVVGLYLGNDIRGATPPLSLDEDKQRALLARVPVENEAFSLRGFLKHSTLLNFLYRLAKGYSPQLQSGHLENIIQQLKDRSGQGDDYVRERLRAADPRLVDAARADTINPWLLATAAFYPNYYSELATVAPGTAHRPDLAALLRDFSVIAEFCRKRGTPVVAVLIPPPVWVSERYQDFFYKLGHRTLGSAKDALPLIQKLKEGLAEIDVHSIDVLDDLRAANDETYLARDDHLNRRGHEIVGSALARWLASSKTIARGP
jgi:lysophospholipase L1-like esterase